MSKAAVEWDRGHQLGRSFVALRLSGMEFGAIDQGLETNFFAAVRVTNVPLPTPREQRARAIVMISSLGGQLSVPGFGA